MKKKNVFFVMWIVMFSPIILVGIASMSTKIAYSFGKGLVTVFGKEI